MPVQSTGRTRPPTASRLPLALAGLGFAQVAFAAEYCVTCAGPEAHYRCSFAGDKSATHDAQLQLACISTLAKQGGHASCSMDGRNAAAACAGTVKVLALPAAYEPLPPRPQSADGAAIAPAGEGEAAMPETARTRPAMEPGADNDVEAHRVETGKPMAKAAGKASVADGPADAEKPKTVEQMLEKGGADPAKPLQGVGEAVSGAAKSTGTALQNAGSAVGNAAKMTWKCLSSLFGDCK